MGFGDVAVLVTLGQVDGPLQPPPSFGDVAMPVPEQRQRLDQPQAGGGPVAVGGRRVRGRGLQRPGQGAAQVVVLGLQLVQGRQVLRARAAQLLRRSLGDLGVVLGVASPGVLPAAYPPATALAGG